MLLYKISETYGETFFLDDKETMLKALEEMKGELEEDDMQAYNEIVNDVINDKEFDECVSAYDVCCFRGNLRSCVELKELDFDLYDGWFSNDDQASKYVYCIYNKEVIILQSAGGHWYQA